MSVLLESQEILVAANVEFPKEVLKPDYPALRREMVERQLRARGIRDERVLNAMLTVARHEFVPAEFRNLSYEDRPISIGEEQTISQPFMVASMAEALHLTGDEKILEVGTGSGYAAAVLSQLANFVYSVETRPALAIAASCTGFSSAQRIARLTAVGSTRAHR